MRTVKLFALLGIALFVAGCVLPVSLHPFYTDKVTLLDPKLVGAWVGKDGEETLTFQFQKSSGRSYRLRVTEGKTTSKALEVHLFKLGKRLFLDTFPEAEETAKSQPTLYDFHLIPAHNLWRIWIERDKVRLAMLDSDWLEKAIKQEVALKHEELDGWPVLTAGTADLQTFITKHATDKEAFPHPLDLRRKKVDKRAWWGRPQRVAPTPNP